ncbi:DUF3077 domain-containing protein [Burkholderia contaminans]|uniref:DUF3077 domain-containing protein n=1 Tax=Burkholderia contaminans TaxID=488447 RepID=A0A6P2Y512_9BURK|nr:DUF3077 domain-containing protein [Burkholderia contaminans]VWD17340.1 hypothetical protein BCO71171_02945 [Burkholderia contaminans]
MKTPFPVTLGGANNLVLVSRDVPMSVTLQEASDALEAVVAIISEEATDHPTAKLFGAVTLLELAKGLTDATIGRVSLIEELEARNG